MLAISCAVTLTLIGSASIGSQMPTDSSRMPEVRTAGTATRSIQPDLATLSVQFAAVGSTPREAGKHLAARADSLRRALTTLGIPVDSLINRARWYWWRNRVEVIPSSRCVPRATPPRGGPNCDMTYDTTYRANDAIEVRMHDLRRIGAVLDTVLGRGITDISDIRFSATDVSTAQDQALQEATKRARAQAEIIASASGMQLGRVLSLTTEADYSSRWDSGVLLRGLSVASEDGQPAPGTVVVHPTIPVSVTVYGRWELVPKP
jgi:uncharacterized protein